MWVRRRCGNKPAPSIVPGFENKIFRAKSRVPTTATAYIYCIIGSCQLVQRRYYSFATVFVTSTSRGRTSSAGRCDYILCSDGVVLIKKTYRKGIPKYQPLESVTHNPIFSWNYSLNCMETHSFGRLKLTRFTVESNEKLNILINNLLFCPVM